MGQIIAVLSGKGGTGKTSVCAGVATALARLGERVLCIDCDVGLRNLDISLGLSESGALSFLDVSEGGYRLEQSAVHPDFPSLRFLTAPMNKPVEAIDPAPFGAMLRSSRDSFDYIFLDAPAGVDAGFRLAARNADRCLVVTGADPAAIRDAARCADLLELMGRHDVRLIVNRINRKLVSTMELTVDDVMDTAGLPLIGVVPEDPGVTLSAAFGKALLVYDRRCAAAKAFGCIAKRIQGRPMPISIR